MNIVLKAAGCLGIALALLPGSAMAQHTWKFASAAQPGSVLIGFVDEAVKRMNEDSKGSIKVERLFVGSEQEAIQQLVRGRIEMASVSMTGASVLIPEAAVLNTPYLWRDAAERDFVTDNYLLPVLQKIYESKGLVIIGLGEVGWNDVVCKTACLTPDTVKGMKVRVSPAPSSKMFWSSMQANGVQMPLSELYPALQSGLVVGADLPFLYYVTTPAAQSAPHYVMTRHLHHPSAFMVNKKVWDGLSPEQRKVIAEARPPLDKMRAAVADTERPKMEEFKKKGGFVHELTAEQRAAWARLVEPNQEQLIKDIGGAAPELWEEVKKGKAAFAARGGK